jgi:hypothetical protein
LIGLSRMLRDERWDSTMTALQAMTKEPDEQPKAKGRGGKRAGAGRKPVQERARDAATLVRSSQAWKDAVGALADWDRATSVSELIDRAIVEYGRVRGYNKPIPKR